MKLCRNCGSFEVHDLGSIGHVAPFFLKRVFGIEQRSPVSTNSFKQFLRKISNPLRKVTSRLHPTAAYLEMQICLSCSFVQASQPFPEDWITRLYLDYRAPSYNEERVRMEPSYAEIAARVGTDQLEVANRMDAATRFLAGKIEIEDGFTMLDYGGADGRFLPALPAQRFVYEISDIEPVEGITRVRSAAELGAYSYVHLAHVLEHVVHPLQLVRTVAEHVKPGGYLYIEVPQDISEDHLRQFREGQPKIDVTVHEHINAYSIRALTKLLEAAGLTPVAVEADWMDLGWVKATPLRALGRKDLA